MRPKNGSPSNGPIGHVALLVARGDRHSGAECDLHAGVPPAGIQHVQRQWSHVRLPIDTEQEKLTAVRRTLWKIGVVIVISAFRFLDWISSLVEWKFGSKKHANEAEESERVER